MAHSDFPVSEIIRWCDNTRKIIKQWRDEEIEERVQYYMKDTKFFGFTICKGMSREDAYKTVMGDGYKVSISEGIDDLLAREYGDDQDTRVFRIKELCLASRTGKITLTSKDLSDLYKC